MTASCLRAANLSDIGAIASVHEAAFAGFFLARMGRAFLCGYYRLVHEYPGGILFVSEADSGIDGFVAGFTDPSAFYAYMSRERIRLYGPALAAVLRRPALLPQVLYNRRRIASDAHPAGSGCCELSSIGVLPTAAGRGRGRTLIDVFCAEAARRGSQRVVLTTDATSNDAVNAFYLRSGFTLQRTFISGNKRVMNEYARSAAAGHDAATDRSD